MAAGVVQEPPHVGDCGEGREVVDDLPFGRGEGVARVRPAELHEKAAEANQGRVAREPLAPNAPLNLPRGAQEGEPR